MASYYLYPHALPRPPYDGRNGVTFGESPMCPNAPTVSLLLTVGAVRTAAEMSPAPAVPAVSTVQTENVKYHTASLTVRLKRRPKRWCKSTIRPSYTNVCSRFSRTVRHRERSTGDTVDISIAATYGQNGSNMGVCKRWCKSKVAVSAVP